MFVSPCEIHSPFKSVTEYEEQTGGRLITLMPEGKVVKLPRK